MWDSVLGQHVEVVRAVTRGNSSEVFACLEEELASLLKAIRPESNWTLPVLYCVCNELKNAAVEADAQDASGKVRLDMGLCFSCFAYLFPERAHAERGTAFECGLWSAVGPQAGTSVKEKGSDEAGQHHV